MSDKDALNRSVLSRESALRKAFNAVKACEKEARARRSDYSASLTRLGERPKNKRAEKAVKENKARLTDATKNLEGANEDFEAAADAYRDAVRERNNFGKPNAKKKKKAAKKEAPKTEPKTETPPVTPPAAPAVTPGNGAQTS